MLTPAVARRSRLAQFTRTSAGTASEGESHYITQRLSSETASLFLKIAAVTRNVVGGAND